MEGAIDAIRAGGPDQSIEELAAAIGVSKPVLYDEFGGKVGLADAVAVVLADRVHDEVIAHLSDGVEIEAGTIVHAIVDAIVRLIEDDPTVYSFIVRTLRASERRFLDNALVRVLHERTSLLLAVLAPGLEPEDLDLLVDGVYGFVWAAVESWQATGRPSRDRMVELLSGAIRAGLESSVGSGPG